MTMRIRCGKLLGSFFVLAVTVAFGLSVASADSPHFLKLVGPTLDTTGADFGDLSVTFKAAGLGNTATSVPVTLSVGSNSSATFQCFTKSGNVPQAENKTQLTSLSITQNFPIRNGQVSGTITLAAPEPPGFCPPGQREILAAVTYESPTLTIGSTGLTQTFATVSATQTP